jgi:hypothetical protein
MLNETTGSEIFLSKDLKFQLTVSILYDLKRFDHRPKLIYNKKRRAI